MLNKTEIIICGTGQLAKLTYKLLNINKDLNIKVVGFIDKKPKSKKLYGIKIYKEKNTYFFKEICKNILIAVGNIKKRNEIVSKYKKKGFKFPTINFSFDKTKSVKIGEGCLILPSTTILPNTTIGKFCVIGTGVNILHDVNIKNNCVIGGGTLIGAEVNLKNNISVGVGSTFASSKITINNNVTVCAGSVVLNNINKNQKVIGNPARVISIK